MLVLLFILQIVLVLGCIKDLNHVTFYLYTEDDNGYGTPRKNLLINQYKEHIEIVYTHTMKLCSSDSGKSLSHMNYRLPYIVRMIAIFLSPEAMENNSTIIKQLKKEIEFLQNFIETGNYIGPEYSITKVLSNEYADFYFVIFGTTKSSLASNIRYIEGREHINQLIELKKSLREESCSK